MVSVDVPREWATWPDAGPALSWAASIQPEGNRLVLPPDTTLRGRLHVRDATGVDIDGNGATLIGPPSTRRNDPHVLLDHTTGVTVHDLTVEGDAPGTTDDDSYDPAREAQHGLELRSTVCSGYERCTIRDVWGDFVYARGTWHGHQLVPVETGWWHHIVGRGAGRHGFAAADGVRDLSLARFDFAHMRRSVVDLEVGAAHATAERITIRDGIAADWRLMFIASKGRGAVNDVTVSGLVACDAPMSVWVAAHQPDPARHGWRFENLHSPVTWDGHRDHCWYLLRTGFTARRIHQPVAPGTASGIRAVWCRTHEVDDLHFDGASEQLTVVGA